MTKPCVRTNGFKQRSTGLQKAVIVSSITAFTWLSSFVPSLSLDVLSISFSNAAYGQSSVFSRELIWRYAAAILDIEPIREKHFEPVRNFYHGNVPPQVCDQDNISNQVDQICSDYKRESASVLQQYQVIGSFNKITSQLKHDKQLREQIRRAITCHQKRIAMTSCF